MTDSDAELDQDLLANAGGILRRRREQSRLTQAQLADRTGTTQATVARIETGGRAPSIAMLGRLFAALGCQARITLEPLDHQTDQAIDALEAAPIAERIGDRAHPGLAGCGRVHPLTGPSVRQAVEPPRPGGAVGT